jgi:hypothetical protein
MGRVLSLAHIAGVPVEETALTIAPVATLLGGAALLRLRNRFGRAPLVERAAAPSRKANRA